jgi:hypothetical protein
MLKSLLLCVTKAKRTPDAALSRTQSALCLDEDRIGHRVLVAVEGALFSTARSAARSFTASEASMMADAVSSFSIRSKAPSATPPTIGILWDLVIHLVQMRNDCSHFAFGASNPRNRILHEAEVS